MICGGTEAAITPMGIGDFFDEALRRETMIRGTRAGRLTRNVMDLSWAKAPGILILELLSTLGRERADFPRRLFGYGMFGDACHITQPAEKRRRAMKAALKDDKLAPEDIGM